MIFAYIDPGAGSLLIQALIAAAVSVPFFFRNTLRSALGRLRPSGQQSDEAAAQHQTEE